MDNNFKQDMKNQLNQWIDECIYVNRFSSTSPENLKSVKVLQKALNKIELDISEKR